MSAVDGIARLLSDAGCGLYSPDAKLPKGSTPITIAGMPAGDGPAIVVTTYAGGPEPDSRNGTEYPRLQIKVRHTNPLSALALERTTYDVLQATPDKYPVDLPAPVGDPGGLLQDCYALQSEAEPLGRDDNQRWEFIRNYQLTYQPA